MNTFITPDVTGPDDDVVDEPAGYGDPLPGLDDVTWPVTAPENVTASRDSVPSRDAVTPDEPGDDVVDPVDVDTLADELRAALTSRQIMQFELSAGITLDELTRTQAGQLVFMVWASRLHGDHPLSIDQAFAIPFDDLATLVLELARRRPKVIGAGGPSPTHTATGSPISPLSGSPIT
jgi:hypothetical protein